MKKIISIFCIFLSLLTFTSCLKYFKFSDLVLYISNLENKIIFEEKLENDKYKSNETVDLNLDESNNIIAKLVVHINFNDGDRLEYVTQIKFAEKSYIADFTFESNSFIYLYNEELTESSYGIIDLKNYYGYSDNISFIDNNENSNAKSSIRKIMNRLKDHLNKNGYSMTTLNILKF